MGACSASFTSEIQGAITVATPDDHGDREAECGGQCSPGESEQHVLDRSNAKILPRVLNSSAQLLQPS